ncbi:MAG TPA: hypothetical protein VI603_06305 [Saprospiraceae bacterium]|nr:hypothetical protein [Saprospiraceae bacterium]
MYSKFIFSTLLIITLFSCKEKDNQSDTLETLNNLAEDYVRLALVIGQYDESFVDAYYGPDSLKPTGAPLPSFPKDSLLQKVKSLSQKINDVAISSSDSAIQHRAHWMSDQLIAFDRRIRIFSSEYGSFDEESKDLFGTAAPRHNEKHFQKLVSQLDAMLPGEGGVPERFQAIANRFIIPKEKLDTVFKAAIAECRKRTLMHYQLPDNENFKLEFVNDKSWSGYNWYKGNYQSVIQINTDLHIFIDRAIDVGSHESYPGHHVYNMLLEKNLYREQGLVEISVYPLYSPQSLIAEGTANYGIDVVFPGNDKTRFAGDVLLPLAGLDTTGISLYFKALAMKGKLNYIRNEVGRRLLGGAMTEEEAMQWLQDYGLYNAETAAKSISFIKNYRTYVINYNYGLDLVKEYIESHGGMESNPEKRWQLFGELLSREVRINEMRK